MGTRRLIPSVMSLLLVWLAGCTLPPSAATNRAPLTVTLRTEEEDYTQFVLHAAYPLTGQGKIDDALAGYAKGAIGEFRAKHPSSQLAPPGIGLPEGGVRDEFDLTPYVTANNGAAFGVIFAQAEVTATFNEELHNYVFAVADGKPITIGDLFRDKAGFARVLSDKATAALKKMFATEIMQAAAEENLDFVDTFITPGAGPDPAHFSNFIVRGGNLEIWFEKCQVAPCSDGEVDVTIPLSELQDNTDPSVVGLFDGNHETARPGDQPPEPSPGGPIASPVATPRQSGTVDCGVKRCLALTFDDGVGPYTGTLLDTLKKTGSHATFFVEGQTAGLSAATMRRTLAEGNEIGNHTWDHPDLTRLSSDEVRRQVKSTQDAVERVTGRRPALFRPPYGVINEKDEAALGLPVVLWAVDTLDWRDKDLTMTTSRVMEGAAPGRIILMHDTISSTVQAMATVIPALIQQGYTLVTVSDLLAPSVPAAGTVVTHR